MTDIPRELICQKFELECIRVVGHLLYPGDGITCDDIEQLCILRGEKYILPLWHYGLSPIKTKISNFAAAFIDVDIIRAAGIVWKETRREIWYVLPEPDISIEDCVSLGDTDETYETFAVLQEGKVVS